MAKNNRIVKKIALSIVGIFIIFVLAVVINLIIFEKKASHVSEGKPIEKYSSRNIALLVVDIQEATTGSVSVNPYYRKNSELLIKNINGIAEVFKKKNIPLIYIRSEISNPLINLINSSFAEGSQGAKFDERLNLDAGLEVVKSKKDAYIDTELDNILIRNKINELYVVGLDAAHCINNTIKAAENRNYRVHIIKEAVLSESEAMKDSMMLVFRDRGIEILHIDSINIVE